MQACFGDKMLLKKVKLKNRPKFSVFNLTFLAALSLRQKGIFEISRHFLTF